MKQEAQQQHWLHDDVVEGSGSLSPQKVEALLNRADQKLVSRARDQTEFGTGYYGDVSRQKDVLFGHNEEAYMIPRQMSQQTHQIQQSWNKNNRKPIASRRRQAHMIYSKKQTGLTTGDIIESQAAIPTGIAKLELLKQAGRDGAVPARSFGGRETSTVHRQLKTFYGQLNGNTGSNNQQQTNSFNIQAAQGNRKELNKNSEAFEVKFAELNGASHTNGSSSVGAKKTKMSLNGPNTATSGWSSSLGPDHYGHENSRASHKITKIENENDYRLFSNRVRSKENKQSNIPSHYSNSGINDLLSTDEVNYYKTSLLRTSKHNVKDQQQQPSQEVGILKSYLKDPNRVQTPETEEAIQRVLQQIMFQNQQGPSKGGGTSSQTRHRALTVGESTSNSSAYLFRNSRKGEMYHIPRYQREIIMRELLNSKSKHSVPNIQNEAKAILNSQNGLKAANRPPKTSKKQKNAKNVIVRRIKSGGGNVAHQASRTMASNGQHYLRKNDDDVKNASKTVDQTQRAYTNEQFQREQKQQKYSLEEENNPDSFKDDDNLLKSHSLGMDNQQEEALELPQKCFDLREARAMFMPHKVPKKEGLDSVDSQEELRNLTGNEIWELTQKAAVYDYQKNAQLRQQYADKINQQYENELGFDQALVEALGFTEDQHAVKNRSHIRREIFLSDDGEDSTSIQKDKDIKGIEDPSNIPSSSNNHSSPRDTRNNLTKDVVNNSKRETRYSHAFVDHEKNEQIQNNNHKQLQYKSQTFKNQDDTQKSKVLKSQVVSEKPKSQNYGSDRTPLMFKDDNRGGIILPKVRNQPKSSFMAQGRAERFEGKINKEALDRPNKSISCTQQNAAVVNDAVNRRQSRLRLEPSGPDGSKRQLTLISQSANGGNIERLQNPQKSTDDKPYKDEEKQQQRSATNNTRSEKPGSRLNSLLVQGPETSRMSLKQQQSNINQTNKETSQERQNIGSIAGKGLQQAATPVGTTITPQRMIPRTGIEQPFLIDPPQHIRDTSDYERTNEISSMLKHAIVDDYKMRDANRIINLAKTVFDIDRESPHYKNQQDYLNNQDQIKLFKSQVTGRPMENPRLQMKNRYFKTLNPWYKLYSCSTSSKDKQNSSSASKQNSGEPTGRSEPIVDDVLLFESRFESGNLKKAIQVDKNEYELILKPDYGTKNFTQWFYFKIGNTRRYREYTFHIINFVKADSQFNDGMMPLFYSKKEAEVQEIGWYRSGYDIAYYQNNQPLCKIYGEQLNGNGNGMAGKFTQTASQIVGVNQKEPTNFYTLSFKFSLKHDNDEVYIAMCYPYTYTDCHKFLDSVCLMPQSQFMLRRASLCKTLAGNNLEMLIITNFQSSQDNIAKRKCIILTGRVHPGESNSSFVMEGLIQFLVSNDTTAVILRDRYVFKIVPMLNPDGVIIGNYRCSLSGHDLNRQYVNPSAKFFPECNAIKQMIRKTLECRKIDLYCDFHGHSRQKDIFMYGCNNNNSSVMPMIQERRYREQIFPMMYDRLCPYFSYNGCSFAIQKAKESTGRVVMWREFQLINSFTCEASFCGPSQGMYKGLHFNIEMLLEMGKDFCRTIAVYSDTETGYYEQILSEIQYLNESSQQYNELPGGGAQGSAPNKGLKEGKVHFLIQNGLAADKSTSATKSLQLKKKQQKTGNNLK